MINELNNLKYIGNNTQRGLAYNWPAIRREFKKLGTPSSFYNPCKCPLKEASWFVEMSERASGKTTNWLLLGLVMYKMYGTVTIYCRSKYDQIAKKNAETMFNVIIDNGYIEKLTDGKYNGVKYGSRVFRLVHFDEDGNIDRTDPDHFCHVVSVDKGSDLKSSCNEPRGDLFLFDEFIPVDRYTQPPNEFVKLVDMLSTVFRLRECCKVVMLANTIDKYNQYFHDLEIFDRVAPLQPSENFTHTTDKGTVIYCEFVGPPKSFRTKKQRWNRLFAGFSNPELTAITGEATWMVKNYPHIPEDGEVTNLFNKLYISHLNKLVRFDFVEHSELGLCIYAHWATVLHDDSIILQNDSVYDSRHHYGTGIETRAGKMLQRMLDLRRVYFASNDVGSFVEGYFATIGAGRRYFSR